MKKMRNLAGVFVIETLQEYKINLNAKKETRRGTSHTISEELRHKGTPGHKVHSHPRQVRDGGRERIYMTSIITETDIHVNMALKVDEKAKAKPCDL